MYKKLKILNTLETHIYNLVNDRLTDEVLTFFPYLGLNCSEYGVVKTPWVAQCHSRTDIRVA